MNQDHIESELQFEASDLEAVAAWIAAQPAHASITIAPRDDKTQQDTYFDTPDWAVFNAGYSLRLRRLPSGVEATLKAVSERSDGPQQRREINQTIAEDDIDWTTTPGPVSDRVRRMTGARDLRALFDIFTHRRSYLLQSAGESLAELSLDDTSVRREGSPLRRLRRMEIEETAAGGLLGVQVLVEALQRACELRPAETSKFEAGLEAAQLSPEAAFDFGYAELEPDASAGEYAYALLRHYLREFLRHEPGTRLGEDPEELHDMRVATRRLRAAMSTFHQVLPLRFQTFRDELKAVGQALGEVRDLDVQQESLNGIRQGSDWEDATALGPLLAELAGRWTGARLQLLQTLDSQRYRTLVSDLIAALREGGSPQPEASTAVRKFGIRVLKKRYKRFRAETEGLTAESEAHLYHVARVGGKHLRYSLEALQPVFGRRSGRMALAMRAVQDLLGEHQDSSVTIDWLREIAMARGAEWPPRTLLRMGELLEQRRARMETLRGEWPETLAEAKDRWRPLRKSMRQPARKSVDDDEDDEAETPSPGAPAVQRPFWHLQRFFRRRPGEEPSS